MKRSIKVLFVISLMILAIMGCKKGSTPAPDPIVVPDTTKPSISITKPTAGQVFAVGNTVTFQATFSDNVSLKSYDIAITNTIPVGLILKNVPAPVPWSYTKGSTGLSAVKQEVINLADITIPLTINSSPVTTGKYYIKVTCLDSSNNSSSTILEININ